MTLNIKVSHVSGDDYAAKVQQQGKPDVVIEKGQEQTFSLWDSDTTNITISEVAATKNVVTTETQADASNATASGSDTPTQGE